MEYNFDDGLSEDWISQPRSSTPSLLKENNVLVKGGSIDAAAGASGARRGKDDRVLCDRTNSALNVKKTRPLEKSSKEEDLSVLHDSNASLGSLQSVPRGTVQHKDDIAAASHHTKETPEWKRRVLEGQKGPGRQHDLFAPMGLESVFKPPTSKGKPQFLQSRLKDRKENRPPLQPTEVFPSSPPPYPSHYYQPLQEDLESSIQLPPLKNSRAIPITNSQAITSSNQSAGGQNEKEYEAMSFVQVNGGRINYESVHQSARRLRVAMQNLGIEEQPRPSSRSSDNGVDYRPKGALGHRNEDNEEADLGDCTSTSLPRDLSADSVNLKSNGGFVTTRRGGYSSDESFQRRPLSPSSFVPPQSSQILNRSSSAASAGSVIRSPRTPRRHLSRSKSSPAVAKPSGSPLKIFSKYDTFTNDKLNRRISQFDTGSYQSGGDEMIVSTPSPRKNRELQERDVDVDDAFRGKRISSFGFGELDEFNFSHRQTKSSVEEPDPKLEDRPDIKSRGEKEGLMSYYEQITTTKTSEEYIEVTEVVTTTQLQDRQLLDGKRPPNSPQKVRNPKRRRMTYENAEVAAGIGGDDYKVLISPSSSSVAGKKRKDARYEESHQEADPSILATRHKLLPKIGQGRPRKPSGVPPSSDHSDDEEEIRIDIDAAAGALADELAQLALNAAQGKTKGERKRSVTTADFWNEAQIIMQHIRAQAPYQEVPRSDQLPGIDESVFPESSREQFSRPASREGSVRKQHILKPLDARVVSHLRKFEEQPEISLALNSSFISHKVDQNILASEPESLESDPPNIRISDGHAKRQHELEVQDQNGDAPLPDNGSNRSNSSNQSVPTGSSGASKSRAIIGPEKVSHLLQENMGGMTFDGARGCWIKKKASKTLLCGENDRLPSDVTEDDPLQAIPDLDVDESQEMRNVMGAINAPRDVSNSTAETAFHVPLPPATAVRRTREGDQYTGNKETDSSVVTKYTNFASSGPKVETRATSWGDELKSVKANQQTTTEQSEDHVRESEAELDILKGQPAITSVPTGTRKNQARVVTVAFSSPLVNVINDRDIETANPLDESSIELDDSIVSRGIETRNPSRHRQASTGSKRSFSQAVGPFVHGQGFTTRTISRIEEDDEPAFLDQDELAAESMQLAITTPQPTRPRDGMLMVPPSSIGRSPGVGFHLSPLSEFTINQADHSLNLDVEYMAKRRGLLSTQEVEGTYSLTIKDLVGKLTDVEPFEPYWEYIRRLELQGKKLLTLHMLDEFCQRIEELDVSNNELGQLNGAPQTLRILNVQGNCLSRLTSWGHLHNLQYLDVSDNDLQSLQGFKNLIHLRELNAEGNKIESLEGILGLSGLIRLKVGRNAIKTVDLREANLERLVELDARDNQIETITRLDRLPALKYLNLKNNQLEHFDLEESPCLTVLESLDISENRLSTLNVGALLRLRHLNVDSNGIVRIRGTRRLRDLERVSWRGQELEDPENNIHMHYACCLEARTLHLSTNRIHKFVTPVPLFLLQRLEIASAGLDELSENFGYHVPNLRYLNLNHNAIKDIKPLLGIEYLHELHLAGNRLAKLRRTITVLSAVGRSLEILDCRINPLSLGFYPAPIGMESSRTASLESKSETKLLTSGTWEEEDEATEALYTGASIDEDSDRQHRGRLDEETSLRRRVYEMMLAHGCENLSRLDGMTLDRRRILQKDKHWERLVVLGIVKVDIEEELTRNLTTRTDEHRDAMPQPNSKAKRSMKPKTPMKSRIHSVKAGGSDECIDSRTPRGHPADLWGEESVRL